MAADKQVVTPLMLRKWHSETFPGLTDKERFNRIFHKWLEESNELYNALQNVSIYDGELPEDVKEEFADVYLTLMSLAEFGGINIAQEAIKKYNVNTNRVWEVIPNTDPPQWRRVRDGREDVIKTKMAKDEVVRNAEAEAHRPSYDRPQENPNDGDGWG